MYEYLDISNVDIVIIRQFNTIIQNVKMLNVNNKKERFLRISLLIV